MRKIAKGLVVSATVLAFAATAVSAFGATKNKWVEKSGVCYYYGSNGKTVSGRTKIGSNYYMFDSKGRQVYGWRLVNGKYQFYGRGKKTGGGLVKNNTVNGIKIDSKGNAVLDSSIKKSRAKVLALYAKEADAIRFSNSESALSTTTRKARACCRYMRSKRSGYRMTDFECLKNSESYVQKWATQAVSANYVTDCCGCGAALAYQLQALGVSDVKVCSIGGHTWTRVGNTNYDPCYAVNNIPPSFVEVYIPVPKKYRDMYAKAAIITKLP